jgi:hypothetical protein
MEKLEENNNAADGSVESSVLLADVLRGLTARIPPGKNGRHSLTLHPETGKLTLVVLTPGQTPDYWDVELDDGDLERGESLVLEIVDHIGDANKMVPANNPRGPRIRHA